MKDVLTTTAIMLAVCLMGANLSAQTIDPLPKNIEEASSKEQLAYIEKLAVESHKEKIAAGIERDRERKAYKKSLAENSRLRAESYIENVRQQKEQASASTSRSKKQMDFFFHCSVLLGIVAVFALCFYYRHSLQYFFSRK